MKTRTKKGKKRPPLPVTRHGKSQAVMHVLMYQLFGGTPTEKEKK